MNMKSETPEIIYMRHDGNDGVEESSHEDNESVAYIRSDVCTCIYITKKRNLYRGHAKRDSTFRFPCDTCLDREVHPDKYPCAACVNL